GRNADQLLFRGPSPALSDALRTVRHKGEWAGELHQVTRAGRDVVVSSRWTLVPADPKAEGAPPAVLVINTDITERKTLENQLQRAQRLESIGVLAGGIAHDLNNGLTPILMAAEVLLRRLAHPDHRSLLAVPPASPDRAAALVDEIR